MANFQMWWITLPTLVPVAYGLLLLVFAPPLKHDQRWLWSFALGGMVVTGLVPLVMLTRLDALGGVVATAGVGDLLMVRVDRLALWMDALFALAGLICLLLIPTYLDRARAYRPEVFPLLFLAVSGMTIMVSTDNLVMIFLGLETLSIPLYILCGLARERASSLEAALKYFILGAFSTGFLVFGIALVFGATGHLDLPGIVRAWGTADPSALFGETLLYAGMALLLAGFAFKIALVPFHFWAPDVYTGAPTPITAFMAAGTKAAAFAVLLRLVPNLPSDLVRPEGVEARWFGTLAVLAGVTMVGGNLLALVQTRVKRLLAFSSIAHAGYLTLAVLAPLPIGAPNLVFYLLAYALMTMGAFAVVTLFQDQGEDADQIARFAGLWKRQPWTAAAMGLFLLSLTGIPPTGGFTGKYLIFVAAWRSGQVGLAVTMGIAAVIGAAYYLKVIVAMFFQDPEEGTGTLPSRTPLATAAALVVTAAGTLALGLFPSLVLEPLAKLAEGIAR